MQNKCAGCQLQFQHPSSALQTVIEKDSVTLYGFSTQRGYYNPVVSPYDLHFPLVCLMFGHIWTLVLMHFYIRIRLRINFNLRVHQIMHRITVAINQL
jgi:hypothetical protein